MERDSSIQDVLLAQKGNKEAFVRLIKQAEPTLYRVARSILKSDSECVDAAQEAILQAYASLHTLKEARYFKTWLVRILMNECYRIAKERNQVVSIGDYMENKSVSDSMALGDSFEHRMELKDAVQSLEKELQVVITLYYLEDLSLKWIANMLDVPEGTVKSRLHRARQKLAEILNPMQGERGVGYE